MDGGCKIFLWLDGWEESQGIGFPSSVEVTVEEEFTHVICPIANWPIPSTPFGICLRWKSCQAVLISSIHRCGMWFTSRGAIPVVELCSLEIGGFCVSWPTEVRKVASESATHTGKSHHDAGGHSILKFICTRWCTRKLSHSRWWSAMINEIKWLDPH